jgi:hypothetical protein
MITDLSGRYSDAREFFGTFAQRIGQICGGEHSHNRKVLDPRPDGFGANPGIAGKLMPGSRTPLCVWLGSWPAILPLLFNVELASTKNFHHSDRLRGGMVRRAHAFGRAAVSGG